MRGDCIRILERSSSGIDMTDRTGVLTDRSSSDICFKTEYTAFIPDSIIKMMASSYELDRQNTVAFVKQYSRAAICERGRLQFVVACLPDDRRLWRASSNDICMKKPNALQDG